MKKGPRKRRLFHLLPFTFCQEVRKTNQRPQAGAVGEAFGFTWSTQIHQFPCFEGLKTSRNICQHLPLFFKRLDAPGTDECL